MALAASAASETVQLTHQYRHGVETVFNAWANPEALGQWFGPHSHNCKVEDFEFTVGGRYQIRMIPVQEDTDCAGEPGEDSICAGEFVEIIPNQRIVMTFTWIENGGDIGETLLTIEFSGDKSSCNVSLLHERLPDEQMRNAHEGGWQGSLECLAEFLD